VAAGPRDLVTHFGRGGVRVARQVELDIDLAAFGAAARGHDIDALDTRKLVFERLGDLRFDHFWRRALVGGVDRVNRLVDVRVLAHGQARIRNQADQHDDQRQHRCEHRPLDADFGQDHERGVPGAPAAAGLTISTGAPSVKRWNPATTTCSPAATPVRISTLPSRRSPRVTSARCALPARTLNTYWFCPDGASAASGTASTWSAPNRSCTRANMPGRSRESGLGTVARIRIERPPASTNGLTA